MDSAIPKHLQCLRTRQRRVPDDFTPPYPSSVARFAPGVKRVVMAYFGVQHAEGHAPSGVGHALGWLTSSLTASNGPGHWDRAQHTDEAGYKNIVSIAYWNDPAKFDRWFAEHGVKWAGGGVVHPGIGTFTEVLRPAAERFETLFSSNVPEGVAVVSDGWSDHVLEHAYWGGMRDRIPLSQTHDMAPVGEPSVLTTGKHRRVIPHENICLIRSGQDWTATESEERRMYMEDVEPVLHAGMNYLRDEGIKVGCYTNRYMTVVDADGSPVEKSFGMSWWRSLADLERWAESHPTHVAIFGAAMKYLGTLGPAAKLKLYHEVTVAAADEQFFEYYDCHRQTGMLRSTG
ncbi:phenylacetaldoxime dehydratase family protein [Caldimonas sp. KR1-144]|uniref:phenylacetaldoxime dehydratase family protein n=1 Tax=Caldimonas sp. KR1-144 TaxID=3400911 RepID=UPI003C08DFCE